MKVISLFVVLFLVFCTAQAQEITVFPGFWKTEYYQDDNQITKQELKTLFSKNEEANAHWEKSNKNSTIAYIAIAGQTAGAFWLGTQLGSEDNGDIVAPLAATLGFGIIAGIFLNAANKNGKRAILTYNKQFDDKTTYRLVPVSNQNGLGLALKF